MCDIIEHLIKFVKFANILNNEKELRYFLNIKIRCDFGCKTQWFLV